MKKENDSCCRQPSGLGKGLLAGILPHSFCIAFIVLSLAGSVFGSALAKRFLLIPNFFTFLVIISLLFATLSAIIYLRRSRNLSWSGIKRKKRYLAVLYGTTVAVNLLFLYIIFPALAAAPAGGEKPMLVASVAKLKIAVDIPCSGHASLIKSELRQLPGVQAVGYMPLSTFLVDYDPRLTTEADILNLEIFKTYQATKL